MSVFLRIRVLDHYIPIINYNIKYTEISTIINQMPEDYEPLSHQVEP